MIVEIAHFVSRRIVASIEELHAAWMDSHKPMTTEMPPLRRQMSAISFEGTDTHGFPLRPFYHIDKSEVDLCWSFINLRESSDRDVMCVIELWQCERRRATAEQQGEQNGYSSNVVSTLFTNVNLRMLVSSK